MPCVYEKKNNVFNLGYGGNQRGSSCSGFNVKKRNNQLFRISSLQQAYHSCWHC